MDIPILRLNYSDDDISFIKGEIEKTLKSGYLSMSKNVAKFEKIFAKFIGVRYAMAVNSGTSSLEIILRIIGVQGKTVIMPSNTYMATPLSAIHAGAKVIFADCQKENLQMDYEDLKKKIRKDTVAVILVHIAGIITPYLEEIKALCKAKGIYLIEDAAHAHGATIDGQRAGALGLAGSFSFYPTKVLTTAEGGMLTTDDKEIYKKALILREHGKADHNFNIHTEFGYNWRFSELHAILGIQQMKKANWILEERRHLAHLYDRGLTDVRKIKLVTISRNVTPSYYKYIVILKNGIHRGELKKKMKEKYGISLTGEVYSHPCHSQPVFQRYSEVMANDRNDKFPNTEYISKHHICLPLYPGLNDEEIMYIIESFKKILS
jgi:dTDP-4-amino-4,6-dideoxygalactose transaminase